MITEELKAIANERKEEVKQLARLKKQILDQPTDIPDGLAVEYLTRYFVFTAFNHFIYNCHCNYDLRFNFVELCVCVTEDDELTERNINDSFNLNRCTYFQEVDEILTVEDAIEYFFDKPADRIAARKELNSRLENSPYFPYNNKNRYFETIDSSSSGNKYKIWFEDINKEFNKFVLNKETIDILFNNINELGFFVIPINYYEDKELLCLSCKIEMPIDLQYILDM